MGVRSLTAPSVANLDLGWWANNGPTGGYLLSLALAAADEQDQVPGQVVRHAAVHSWSCRSLVRSHTSYPAPESIRERRYIRRLQAAPPVRHRAGDQRRCRRPSRPGDATPSAGPTQRSLSPDRDVLATGPVTQHFEYRPTGDIDGRGPRDGWDVVWLTPLDTNSKTAAARRVDVRLLVPAEPHASCEQHLRNGEPLCQPSPTVLTRHGFVHRGRPRYDDISHALLASQVTGTTGGWIFERHEIWSQRGVLLAAADLAREISQGAA